MSETNIDNDPIVDNTELSDKDTLEECSCNNCCCNEAEDFSSLTEEEKLDCYKKLSDENLKLKEDLKDKEVQSNDYLDKYKRTLADMENLRKRTQLEKQDSLKYANFNILADLVSILDDFQRAIQHAKTDKKTNLHNFCSGIEMIEKQFAELLTGKYGIIRYGERNEPFNPNIHSALMMEEGKFAEELVLDVFRCGYKLHDRVIRPAEVKVGKPRN